MKTESSKTDQDDSLSSKLILVIKSDDQQKLPFMTYLKGRNWNIEQTSELKKALASLLGQRFQCVLISVQHPNPKCLRLPDIISKTVKTPVILFAENATKGSTSLLRTTNHPYVLYPPVSGPAIERLIAKMNLDRQRQTEIEDKVIRFSGNTSDGSSTENFKSDKSYTMDDLILFFEGDGKIGTGATNIEGQESAKHSTTAEGNIAARFNSPISGDEANSFNQTFSELQSQDLSGKFSDHAGSMNGKITLGNPNSQNFNHQEGLVDSSQLTDAERVSIYFKDAGGESETSILVRGAEHALANITSVRSQTTAPTPQRCSNVTCFKIRSERFAGFVIVAFGASRESGPDLNRCIQGHLVEYLKRQGIDIAVHEMLDLRLNEVSFEDWSMREAAFLRKTIYQDDEIALAFFPGTEKTTPLELSAQTDMYKFDLEELREDTPLEFDCYLYLEKNEKYVKYVAKDKHIANSQRSRLLAGGVNQVHIRKDSENDITRYRVQNFLNDLIKKYEPEL